MPQVRCEVTIGTRNVSDECQEVELRDGSVRPYNKNFVEVLPLPENK